MAATSITVLTPTGTLGYGFGTEALARGMEMRPDVIAVDAGSTDPGPHYLGSGETLVSRISIKRELEALLAAGRQTGIPLVVGSAGGAGTTSQVDWTAEIVHEIAREEGYRLKLARIYAEIPIARAKQALSQGEIRQFEASFPLTDGLLDETVTLVAQMGFEPIGEALAAGADVVIAGRAVDDCAIAAYPVLKGADPAQAIHMGKVLECGAFSAEPFAMDVMVGTVNDDHFILEPGSAARVASVASVAAHSLYEREDPFFQGGPGHGLDLRDCKFEQVDQRRVRVSGARLVEGGDGYWVKLEGARVQGHRTVSIAGVRCPTMIEYIDEILEDVRRKTLDYFADNALKLTYHVYGRDGVMKELEQVTEIASHELGLVIETVAPDQETAHAACHHASGTLLHYHYPGQVNTSGNLAFPYSPSELDAGQVYAFSAYHLMKAESPTELFPICYENL